MQRIPKETSNYINSLDRITFDPLHEQTLNRIIAGLMVVSLTTLLVTLFTTGFFSIWLGYAGVILAGALAAYLFRSIDRDVVAAVILVVTLTGVIAAMLLQPTALTSFGAYLFIPVVIIASLTLSLPTIFLTAASAIVITLSVLLLTQQLTLANLLALVAPLSLTIIVTLLAIESNRQVKALQRLVLDNKQLLRERTWETVEAQRKTKELHQQVDRLEQQLAAATHFGQTTTSSNRLYDLITGAMQELDTSVKELEHGLEQLEEFATTELQLALLEQLWSRLYHLTNLKISVAELARLEHEDLSLRRQEIDLAELISEVVSAARGLIGHKHITLRYHIEANLPPLPADPNQLRQALLRLLNNAVQYTDEGIIEVQAAKTDHELIISISDTGIGLAPQDGEVIFQQFKRGRNPQAKPLQGPGLGLAISERLIRLHSGRMWVKSVTGVGSTFYVALPLPRPIPDNQPLLAPAAMNAQTDLAATLVSSKPVPMPLLALDRIPRQTVETPPKLGPVARYSSTYTNRFGFILLSLLVILTICVALLALRYGISQSEATVSAGSPSSPATATLLVSKPTSNLALSTSANPTASPTATLSPTLPPLATLPATSVSEQIPPTATARPTATLTPTPVPPTSSPTPLFPTPLATATPTPATPTTPASDGLLVQPATITQAAIAPVERQTLPPPKPQLAYVTDQDGIFVAMRLNLVGQAVEPGQAVPIQTANNSGLSWSPAGQILYTVDRNGKRDIFVANSDGSQPHQLTLSAGDNSQPVWSPDGRKIAFSSGRTGNLDIFVMEADGTNPQQLTDSRGFDEWPVWSPDGQQIAFVSDRDGNVEIYTMNIDGSAQKRLTNHPADDWPAAWSPDSRQLVFSSNRDGNWNLYMLELSGPDPIRLTNDPANERDPAWSPDGQSIAFAYDGSDNWDIYTLPLPPHLTSELPRPKWRQRTATPLDERYPTWLP